MSRAATYTLLEGDIVLSQYDMDVYGANAVDTPAPPLFIVLRWEQMQDSGIPGYARGPQGLTVWVYDEPADYSRINTIIERVKAVLTAAVHIPGTDGWSITQVAWRGDSQDLYDDAYERIVRTTSFEVGSKPTS